MKHHYDYIIVGAGCAGLSLLVKMIAANHFQNKQILLIDREQKNINDRTWCFWEKGKGFFENLVYHQWSNLYVKNETEKIELKIDGYNYKMILGIDFYNYCFKEIEQQKNITVYYGDVKKIDSENGIVLTENDEFKADIIFSSILLETPVLQKKEFYLLQHFRGWWIETEDDFFNALEADLMDFRTSQANGCTFLYVLPVSNKKALVEYTLFSENKLADETYNAGLVSFVANQLGLKNYSITAIENGVIPMTNIHFPKKTGKIIFIGTAGGQTKASTGYTFQFIQKQTTQIVENLIESNLLYIAKTKPRFNFYDGVLLRVLAEKKIAGAVVFFNLFKKNNAALLFKFLDNETIFFEELKIMLSTNQAVFIPAALKQLF